MKTFELINNDGLKSVVTIKYIVSVSMGDHACANKDDDGFGIKWVIDVYTGNSWSAGVYETKEECELAFKELNILINDEL